VKRNRFTIGALLIAGAAALVAASIGAAQSKASFRMAIVTDIGSLQDRSFNQLANTGRLTAQKQLGIPTRVYVTNTAADRTPNLVKAARDGYNLIFGVGFLHFDGLNKVAPRFPKLQFAGIDVAYALLSKKPKNAAGIIFAEHEAGYLVGYLAGLTVKRQPGADIISSVGANNVPAIVRFMSGYIQGAKKANPRVKVLSNFANDPTFSDEAKCKETALGQIQQGSQVVFQVAGKCGLGALSAAKENGVWGIGVDADQRYLGPHMLTSAVKRVDVAVVELTKLAQAGNLATGRDYNFNLINKGVALGSVSPKVPKADVTKTLAIGKQIATGKITIKPIIKF
jgi:basic membrane protein A